MFGVLVAGSLSAAMSADTVVIAPGVAMPLINLGGVSSSPSNYSLWIETGGRGIDTALMYGEDVQNDVRTAVKSSSLPRESIFVTTKIPCCPAGIPLAWCNDHPTEVDPAKDIQADLEQLGINPCGSIVFRLRAPSARTL
jgi:diketogulonate reductase-like aldo/keto reductase